MKNTSDYLMLGLLLICMRLDKKVCYKELDNNYSANKPYNQRIYESEEYESL